MKATTLLALLPLLAVSLLVTTQAGATDESIERRVEELERRVAGTEPQEPASTEVEDDGLLSAVVGRFAVRLYGRVNVDSSYDEARTDTGNFARWIESATEAGDSDDEFNLSANTSRLGLRVDGPPDTELEASAQVEMDFLGNGGDNKPNARLRLAELRLRWSDLDLDVVAGQSWDLVHPLMPRQLNFVVGWWSGNIGFRRPQIQVHKGFALGGGARGSIAVAASRTVGDPIFPGDVGGDSGFPTGQGRTSVTIPGWTGRPIVLGVSGHVGEQECDDIDKDFTTWSAGVDLTLPISEHVTLTGELWRGQAVCAYQGGIGQGVNPRKERAIDARGGWAAISVDPAPGWNLNLGGGTDNPQNDDLNRSQRTRNTSFFGNAIYTWREAVSVGLEVMWMRTTYKRIDSGESWRAMSQIRYAF